MNPLISVIIPAYNCEKTVGIALESILNQTYDNLEIIVVDDKSTDKTKDIVSRYCRIHKNIVLVDGEDDPNRFDKKLNRNVNAGWSARNTGFKHVHGEYITFQDADDASLLNRIEVQYNLLILNSSTHIIFDWFQFNPALIGKQLNVTEYVKMHSESIMPEDLYRMSQRSKGLIAKVSKKVNALIPFHVKRKRIINKIFFGTLENYPGLGNSPLFKREVIDKVRFRPLKERVWPSFMGRGADKDFNFQVAETFRNSHVFFIPLYMWRVPNQNPRFISGIDKYLL